MRTNQSLNELGTEKFIYLTTTGRITHKPHRVELWFAVVNGKVFLSHEGQETDWMRNIRKDSKVSFEIGGIRFAGEARCLGSDDSEAAKGKFALYMKYYGKADENTIEDWFSLSTLIVIDAKP